MRERKVWSEEQDKILRLLREERGEQKWARIARIMQTEFGLHGRTGKQCRQRSQLFYFRYHNHLDSSIVTAEWSQQQQQILFKMHEQVGNKWSAIAQKLPGRSQNFVKNHFYSKLRKAVRKLNKLMQQNTSGHRMLRQSLISKIVKTTESKFNFSSKVDEELAEFCNCIKNRLLRLENEEDVEVQIASKIVADIQAFEKNYKKGYKCVQEEIEYQYKTYLKPPTSTLKKSASTRSISSEKSEDSCFSFLSSSGCFSSSDLSSYDQDLQSNKSSNTPAQKSLGRTSGRYSQQIAQTQHIQFSLGDQLLQQKKPSHNENVLKPQDFQIEYQGLIMQDSEIYSINNQMRQINFDQTPHIGSILAPIDSYAPFYMFENEDEGIEFKSDCDRMDLQ